MKTIIQRSKEAHVSIKEDIIGAIDYGLVILLGIHIQDTMQDIEWLINKIVQLRIFSDEEGKMNKSIQDVNGSFLVISQFTLYASTKKGNRPSYINAARPEAAIPLYNSFIEGLKSRSNLKVETGEFGGDMRVSLINDGPVTIVIDTRNKE